MARAAPGLSRAFPLTDISKCSGSVCGRDLEETHPPGGHSDEVLPAVHLTSLAANVLSLAVPVGTVLCTLFNASCGFISITGKTWWYLGMS